MTPLPADPGWRATVEAMIREIEQRRPTTYNELCLAGWRAELARVAEGEAYWKAKACHD